MIETSKSYHVNLTKIIQTVATDDVDYLYVFYYTQAN